MTGRFLSTENLPFCKGCGHGLVANAIEKALGRMENLDPLDLIVVTDIGCIGIIDKQFKAHTVHGLHGRSAALATGISMGLDDPRKKIIVFIGDGGATIGLHHILEAAHRNIDMTVLVHNNMLYGMTGGQPSGLTPCGFRTATMPDGRPDRGMDICRLVHSAGAAYARRIYALGDITDTIEEAFRVKGFSLLETVEICPSYGVKFNPGKKLQELTEEAGLEPVLLRNDSRSPFCTLQKDSTHSLLQSVPRLPVQFRHGLKNRLSLILAGSAGEGVQSTAEILARAAISSGLSVTKKGSYPVTVGVGFSLAELIVSTEEIDYTGISSIDAALVTSRDGLERGMPKIAAMDSGTVYMDSSLETPDSSARFVLRDYRAPLGSKSACLLSAAHLVKETGFIPMEAFLQALASSRAGKSVTPEKLKAALDTLA
jgi:2-oxoglutarate/2-oxoacid ferredoxin oxidoreductase subunit beta